MRAQVLGQGFVEYSSLVALYTSSIALEGKHQYAARLPVLTVCGRLGSP